MLLYSQCDPRWSKIPIGDGGATIGSIGCLLTDIAMLSTYFHPDRDPAYMAQVLHFDTGGYLYFDSAKFENFEFYMRDTLVDINLIRKHIKDPRLAVALQVQNGHHWVLAIGAPLWGTNFRIADPWLGDRADMRRYGAVINGAAYFRRK